ncbi:TIGR03086 family metal-binding protein [Streptomyces sannanensis]|uniref:TIGR03086 family metal-binding protein n=1 Tax=Streptomyces sannanensis TaxID=285536 RepID=A0ABP6SIP7_9ACTN
MAAIDQNTLLERLRASLDLFGGYVHAVRPDQWGAPTPCAEWSVRDLVNHLTGEQLWVVPLVGEGRTIADVGDAFDGDVLGDDPAAAWDAAARGARDAFSAPGALDRTVRLSYGPSPAVGYCSQMAADAIVHSWDLARAIGADDRLPAELVDFAEREYAPYVADLAKSGVFGPPVEPPPGADAQTRLLSVLGRRV